MFSPRSRSRCSDSFTRSARLTRRLTSRLTRRLATTAAIVAAAATLLTSGCVSIGRHRIAPQVSLASFPFRAQSSDLLGINISHRPELEEEIAEKGWGNWMLDRFLDCMDILTINVGAGLGAHIEVHVTQAMRFGGGGGYLASFGTGEAPREFGLFGRGFAELSFGPAQLGIVQHNRVFSTVIDCDHRYMGLMLPEHELFQEKRDYFSFGFSIAWIFFGGQLEFHPMQFADFITGFFGHDMLEDDGGPYMAPEEDEYEE